jgi:GNAT superfamily N-acetyltransferase
VPTYPDAHERGETIKEDRIKGSVRALNASLDAEACDDIVRGLPEWFGNEEGLKQQAQLVRTSAGMVCVEDGEIVGFLTYVRIYPRTAEVTWMAVRSDRRRRGIGTTLLGELTPMLTRDGARMLVVKTLSDREEPGPEYAETRSFYLARGFVPVAELDIWGAENPCQLLVMALPT